MARALCAIRWFARVIRVPIERAARLLAGEEPVDADMALRLARLFGGSADGWLHWQSLYELGNARERLDLHPGQQVRAIEYDGRIEFIPVRSITSMRGLLAGIDSTIERDEDRERPLSTSRGGGGVSRHLPPHDGSDIGEPPQLSLHGEAARGRTNQLQRTGDLPTWIVGSLVEVVNLRGTTQPKVSALLRIMVEG